MKQTLSENDSVPGNIPAPHFALSITACWPEYKGEKLKKNDLFLRKDHSLSLPLLIKSNTKYSEKLEWEF